MSSRCEICGGVVHGSVQTVLVDEAVFRVCPNCSRLGTPVRVQATPPRPKLKPGPTAQRQFANQIRKPELELRSDYSKVIRNARAKHVLSQEQLGMKINEKPSVIKHLESGKLKPDDHLARKIEHFLKVKLLVPPDEDL